MHDHRWKTFHRTNFAASQNLVTEIIFSTFQLVDSLSRIKKKKKVTLPRLSVAITTTDCFAFASRKAGKVENKILMI